MPASPQPLRILFVCMGNICRSPAGECVLRHLATTRSIETPLEIDSAGTINFHSGKRPDHRMRQAGAARGVSIDGAARQVAAKDLKDFDLILPADNENLADLLALPGADHHRQKIHLFCAFTGLGDHASIPDPYYGGADGFEIVLDLLEAGCAELLRRITRSDGISRPDHPVPES